MNTNTLEITLHFKDDGSVVVDQAKGKIKDLDKAVGDSTGTLKQMHENWVGLTAKITAATAVVYGVSKALSSFVNEAAEAEQIENRLRFALETTGYQWSIAKSAVDAFATSIQETTRFSDEQARQALTDMMMYTRDFGKAQMGAKLAMDLSIRTGQDLGSTSRLIGMAMSGNVEMLGRYIPELRNLDDILGKNATMAQKAEYALKILQEKFAGTAQNDVKSYIGTVAQFKNAWSDFKEVIGDELLPILKNVFETLTNIVKLATKGPSREEARKKWVEEWWGGTELPERYAGLFPKPEEGAVKAPEPLISKKDVFTEAKKDIDIVKEVQSAIDGVTAAYELQGQVFVAQKELEESGWSKQKDIVQEVKEEIERLERETNEWGEVTVGRQELVEAGWKKVADEEAETLSEGVEYARLMHQAWLEEYTKVTEGERLWQSFGDTLSSVWNENVTGILRGTIKIGDGFKNMAEGMADAFFSSISKMTTQWLLFGSITGKQEPGGGFLTGGSWSGLLGGFGKLLKGGSTGAVAEAGATIGGQSIFALGYQHGTPYVPQTGLALLHKGEAVIPAEKNKGGDTYINNTYVEATDLDSFVRRYGPTIESIYYRGKRFNKMAMR